MSAPLRIHGWSSTIELLERAADETSGGEAATEHDVVSALRDVADDVGHRRALARLLDDVLPGAADPDDPAALVQRTTDALRRGRLVARRHALPWGDTEFHGTHFDLSSLESHTPPPSSPPPQADTPTSTDAGTTWFEVSVVDELGEAVEGVPVIFHVDGTRRTVPTDGSGLARLEDADGHLAAIELEDTSALRQPLHDRWRSIRPGEWLEPDSERTVIQLRRQLDMVSVRAERPHVISVQQRLVLARLAGMLFDTDKTFLLPSALSTIRDVKALYDENPGAQVLALGHTDSVGDASYNLALSLERASMVLAYLGDDVASWLQRYTQAQPAGRLWGTTEDLLMIEAMPDAASRDPSEPPVQWYQRTRGLAVDGVAGPQTREQLIGEYMAADDTTLPAGTIAEPHGCGEGFPLVPAGDGADVPENRRVEIFLFEDEFLPPPPGPTSPPEGQEVPEWVRRARETHEFRPGEHVLAPLMVTWSTAVIELLSADTTLTLSGDGIPEQTLRIADGVVDGGVVAFVFEHALGTEPSTLVAKAGDRELVLWEQQIPAQREPPLRWLGNLADLAEPQEYEGDEPADTGDLAVADQPRDHSHAFA